MDVYRSKLRSSVLNSIRTCKIHRYLWITERPVVYPQISGGPRSRYGKNTSRPRRGIRVKTEVARSHASRVRNTRSGLSRPRPSSERLHLWKKVMKVHQDRQLRVCTHAQAQIQCRYAYLPKIGRHQNQTRSAGRSSPPVVDLYRQTHLARSELLRTPRDTSIYQGQFYP